MKKLSNLFVRFGTAVSVFAGSLVAKSALAQGALRDLPTTGETGLSTTGVRDTIITIIFWALGIAGSIAVLFLIVGGFLYITAAGDSDRLDKAKATIKNSIIGIVVILLSLVIVFTLNTIL